MVDMRASAAAGHRAIQEDPTNALAYLNTCIALDHLSYAGASRSVCTKAAQLGSRPEGGLSAIGVNTSLANLATGPSERGDYATTLRQLQDIRGEEYTGVRELNRAAISTLLTAMHDISGSRRVGGVPSEAYLAAHFANSSGLATPQVDQAVALEDWPRAIALLRQMLAVVDRQPEGADLAQLERERTILPRLAIYMALDGQIDQARSIAAALPIDCFNCVIANAAVAGLTGDFAKARRLIGTADATLPNSPFVDEGFAELLFRAGRYKEALEFATRATANGPRFADALKVRGDALRKLGRVEEADKFYAKAEDAAPRWGRLQIARAVADYRLGKTAQAHDRLAKAATLDLSAKDRILLSRLQATIH
jgi:tetratricopeptide (TPR) repeat protein